jgi:hypothetical protein
MASTEFDKYIVYRTPNNPFHPPGSFPGTEVISINANPNEPNIQGAPQINFAWWFAPEDEREAYKPHKHLVDEYVSLIGSDPQNPWDLNGEVEWWFEDVKYLLTKSCVIYIPKNLRHAPIIYRKITKPILFVNVLIGEEDHPQHAVSIDDPKWIRFKDPRLIDGLKEVFK